MSCQKTAKNIVHSSIRNEISYQFKVIVINILCSHALCSNNLLNSNYIALIKQYFQYTYNPICSVQHELIRITF